MHAVIPRKRDECLNYLHACEAGAGMVDSVQNVLGRYLQDLYHLTETKVRR